MERVFVCDVGSVRKGRFAWCSSVADRCGREPESLAVRMAEQLIAGHQVSFGVECPLFVPVFEQAIRLPGSRDGECRTGSESRPYAAAGGACSLVTGLVELCWILRRLTTLVSDIHPTFSVDQFDSGESNFFIWEAFVTAKAKGDDHIDDARVAMTEYQKRRRESQTMCDVVADPCLSLVGAALLWAGSSSSLDVLKQPCCVLRVGNK